MRIISGFFKGKTLDYLKNATTRPLKDVVKENIFNILVHSNLIKVDIKNSIVLDAYSGIGSFGLECLSRGAKKIFFVEESKDAIKILEKNITLLSVVNKSEIFNCKIEKFLDLKKREKFNIIFFDPPFIDEVFVKNLSFIKNNHMYCPNHLVVIHREKDSNDKLDKYINVIFSRKYGRSKILFGNFN